MTRGRRGAHWTLITPDNHYVSRLAALQRATVVKLATPRIAPARFGQYLVRLEPGGGTREPVADDREHFVYVLDGAVGELGPGGYAYVPPGAPLELGAPDGAILLWLNRPYEPAAGFSVPGAVSGNREDEPFTETATPGVRRRELLPVDEPGRDFAMSILQFDAGCGLPQVEIHDEEHGLWMTAGGGTYFLDGEDLPVQEGDFIYMAPYCPQSFMAGPDGGEYLLYKDAWRDGFPFVQATAPMTR